MKRKATKRPLKKRIPPRIQKMFAAAAEEMQASPHELAGRLLARSQGIETQMKLYITRSDQATKLESLEGKTFGQLLGIFTKHSQDQTLNDWLESMRDR